MSARATLRDVAGAAGVDISTASRALRGDPRVADATVAQVRAAAERLGYRPNLAARALQAGATRTVWFLAPGMKPLVDSTLADEAARVLAPAGYDTLIAVHHGDAAVYDHLLGRLDLGLADATVILPSYGAHHDSSVLRGLLARRFPLVFCDRHPGWPGVPAVTTANAEAAAELVRRLAAAGCARLVVVEREVNVVAVERRQAALAEARRLGLPVRPGEEADDAWLAGGGGQLGVLATDQDNLLRWCRGHADRLRGSDLRFACFDQWDGEPHPARTVYVAVQDLAGLARRAAERVLAAIDDTSAWSDACERLPITGVTELSGRF